MEARKVTENILQQDDLGNATCIGYTSNTYRKADECWGIEWNPGTNTTDEQLFRRLINYCFTTSFDAERTENGGWVQPGRPDGQHSYRHKGEIFLDVFIGKLGEFALYEYLHGNGFTLEFPNITEPRGYGNSDYSDIECLEKHISVKTSSEKANLLLLEERQYNEQGEYIPNIDRNDGPRKFDYHVFCKYSVNVDNIKRNLNINNKDVLSDEERGQLIDKILSYNWKAVIVGFITHGDFLWLIENDYKVLANSNDVHRCFGKNYNERTMVDVNNFYVQGGNTHNIELLLPELMKDEYINELQNSVLYSDTHVIISKLYKCIDYSQRQVDDLCQIAVDNSQIKNIIRDTDVYSFYKNLTRNCNESDIVAEVKNMLNG